MKKIKITPSNNIATYKGKGLSLPNGVDVLSDGSIVVADGGNNRICLFNNNGLPIKSIGSLGIGQYLFKEPVGVFCDRNDNIFVTDWHNHRVVIFDKDLNYKNEFGHFCQFPEKKTFKQKLFCVSKTIVILSYRGSYIKYHFNDQVVNRPLFHKRYSIRLLFSGLKYLFERDGSVLNAIRKIISSNGVMNKPNGIAFHLESILVSQKNTKCISKYFYYSETNDFVLLENILLNHDNKSFGRLGNIMCDHNDYLYVCDEYNSKVWVFNEELKCIGGICGKDSGLGSFMPFSCCSINEKFICVCGGLNFQIININSKIVEYCSENIGELHGVSYDKNTKTLYIVDRSNGLIRSYRLFFN